MRMFTHTLTHAPKTDSPARDHEAEEQGTENTEGAKN